MENPIVAIRQAVMAGSSIDLSGDVYVVGDKRVPKNAETCLLRPGT